MNSIDKSIKKKLIIVINRSNIVKDLCIIFF